MKKTLALKTEHLTELSTDELTRAVGGSYTGQVDCILSFRDPCQSVDVTDLTWTTCVWIDTTPFCRG